ncbi:ribosome biogenesis protein C1orf109 homolog isoform X2 [Erpetoichthys calabaricus]|uniref:Uncharacterized protein n=2 Tax=Erpetoichthys calabaricus TaxID=27687 RepID=A0A8C4T1H6_ERPCA|nr:ribosome biogenesis protein C1orf109 homolog isoform X2 [Erpetoichthys calabaricus]XP_028675277.1 ribosome biogenesis protein C1orf109 homolog isoform X2 [Erpetoichthys calabaricus]
MSQEPTLSVLNALKNCFRVIERQQHNWSNNLAECTSLIISLGNLGEQLQSCNKVDFKGTPLQDFPQLKQRLTYKLNQALGVVLGKLADKLSALQVVRDSISNQVVSVFQLYENNSEKISLSASLRRLAVIPSLADMLEWLQDIDRFYRNQYLKRKLMLQMVSPENMSYIVELPKLWKALERQQEHNLTQETLMKIAFFMDSS